MKISNRLKLILSYFSKSRQSLPLIQAASIASIFHISTVTWKHTILRLKLTNDRQLLLIFHTLSIVTLNYSDCIYQFICIQYVCRTWRADNVGQAERQSGSLSCYLSSAIVFEFFLVSISTISPSLSLFD
jgi:hypothetical protein